MITEAPTGRRGPWECTSKKSRQQTGRRARCLRAAADRLVETLESRVMLDGVGSFYLPPEHSMVELGTYLSAPSDTSAQQAAIDFLTAHAADLALNASDLVNPLITDQYTDADTGTTHIYLRQRLNNLEISNANLSINVARDGRIINVGSTFIGLANLTNISVVPQLTAAAALLSVSDDLAINLTIPTMMLSAATDIQRQTILASPDASLDPIPARLHYVAVPNGLTLAWDMILRTTDGDHWYNVSVDAVSGALVAATDWVEHAVYKVLPQPTENPEDGARVALTDPHDPVASPFGWQDTNGVAGAEFTDTRGNNVSAQDDVDANNTGGFRPDGGASLNFDFPLDLTLAPSGYQSAAITNLFYWNNLLHDVHYKYGFTEAAGNFQVNNYGKGGLANDGVQADAQDGSGTNNANFATPPDGSQPRMQMYIFTSPNPDRDGDLDNGIITHEYGHGVSNRLTGGPANSNALNAIQSGGMGEGWSDWWALMFTQKPTDVKLQAYPMGNYALGQVPTGPGIRRKPYSYDMTIDPLTFDAYGTSGSGGGVTRSTEVHNTGELWASALWDMTWLLIDKYGYNPNLAAGYTPGGAGNLLALKLVMDALKLQPANPSFTQARDAIIQADTVLNGGANLPELWTAFARRGLGLSASVGTSSSTTITPAFNLPVFGLTVTSATPAAGTTVFTQPTDFVVNFNFPYTPASVNASDLTVNGISASSFTLVDADTVSFHYNSTPVTAQGLQTMAIAGGAMTRLSDSTASVAFSSTFRYDALAMQVVATSPVNGSTATVPLTTIDVTFNEVFNVSTLAATDLKLSTGTVIGSSVLNTTTARFTVSGLTAEGTVTITMDAGSLTDNFGNPMLAYSGGLTLDIGTAAYPTPLLAIEPRGSLIFDPSVSGFIGTAGDTDTYTLGLDAGQLLTLVLDTSAGLRGAIAVLDPSNNLIGSASASASNLDAVLANLLITVAGTYKLVVSGVGSSTGAYSLQAILNADVENDIHDGASNSTLATAQNLDAAMSSVVGNATRGALLGRLNASEDWYKVTLAAGDYVSLGVRGLSAGTLNLELRTGANALLATGGTTSTQLTSFIPSFLVSSGGTYYARITGTLNTEYSLVITRNAVFDKGNNTSIATAQSIEGQAGAVGYLPASGGGRLYALDNTAQQIREINPTTGAIIRSFSSPVTSSTGPDFGLAETPTSLLVGGSPSQGIYELNLDTGAIIRTIPNPSIGVSGMAFLNNEIYLLTDAVSGQITVLNYSTGAVARTISGTPVTEALGASATGLYGTSGSTLYQINPLTGGATSQGTVSLSGAEGLGILGTELYLAGFSSINVYDLNTRVLLRTLSGLNDLEAIGADGAAAQVADDYYSFFLAAGQKITLSTKTPGDGVLEPVNALNPRIRVLNGSGTVLASDDNSAADGRNARLVFTAATSGTYYVDVLSSTTSSTVGEYFLVVDRASITLTLPTDVAEAGGSVAGTLSVSPAPASDLTVTLSSSNSGRIGVPLTLVIPAGQTSVPLPLNVFDNPLLDGPEAITISATAANYSPGSTVVNIHDNETAILTVNVPASATEGAGPIVSTINSSAAPTRDLVIQLVSSNTSRATAPTTVILLAGQTSANFNLSIVNNTVIDGAQAVNVTASLENWTSGVGTVNVADNDGFITVTLPTSGFEGQTLASAGTVQLGGTLPTNLTVTLGSSDTTELTVPVSVTVLAGQTTATFTLTLLTDLLKDGSQIAMVTASAGGLTSGSSSITVRDANLDHVVFDTISSPKTVGTAFSATARAFNIANEVITTYNASLVVSATGQAGSLAMTTTPASPAFASGVWTGNVTINAVDPTVTLQATAPGSVIGTSNVFAVQAGSVASFQWSSVASPQTQSPFGVTVTAKDANGFVATGFNGTVNLTGVIGGGIATSSILLFQTSTAHHFQTALTSLGLNFTIYTTEAAFNTALAAATPATSLAIIDVPSILISVTTLPAFIASGGRTIFSYWDLDTLPTIASSLGATVAADFTTPLPVYDWGGSSLFAGVSTPMTFSNTFNDDGDRLQPVAGALAVGGFQVAAAANQAAIVIGNSGRTIVNGFLFDEAATAAAAVQLAKNEIQATLGIGGKLVPITPTSATFTGGIWSGSITVLQAAIAMHLHADDGSGHIGDSNNFDVLGPAAPAPPDLVAATDSGILSTDNITNFNNSAAVKALQFSVANTIPGATVGIYSDGVLVGSAVASSTTTLVTTSGALTIVDGTRNITARQTVAGQGQSFDSSALSVTFDTLAPTTPVTPDLQTASDTGVSSSDNITPITTPVFTVAGSPYFRFYRNGIQLSGDYQTGTTYALSTQTDGAYTYAVASVDAAGNVSTLSPLSVTIDTTAPAIVGSSIQNGAVLPLAGVLTYVVTFSEAMPPGNLDATDVTLLGITKGLTYIPASLVYSAGNTVLTLTYNSLPEDSYTLTLLSANARFEDPAGNDLDGEANFPIPPNRSGNGTAGGSFVLNFATDIATTAFPTPLTAKPPLGSLIYDPIAAGVIGSVGDSDSFTLSLDANQTLSLVVHATSAALWPSIELRSPSNVFLAGSFASGAGKEAFIETAPVSVAGVYTITVYGSASTTGAYTVSATLNAALETESHDGFGNDTLALAQDINGSFITLSGNASRGAVIGRMDVSTPFTLAPTALLNVMPSAAAGPLQSFKAAAGGGAGVYQMNLRGEISMREEGPEDVDVYSLGTLHAGDVLTVQLATLVTGRGTLGDSALVLMRGSPSNPETLATSDDWLDAGSGYDSPIYRYPIDRTDSYYVKVLAASDNAGTYQVNAFLEATSGTALPTSLTGFTQRFTEPADAGDSTTDAAAVSSMWQRAEYLAHQTTSLTAGAAKYYGYEFAAGDVVTFVARSGLGLDATLSLWDAYGNRIAVQDGATGGALGESPIYAVTIPTAGSYFLKAQSEAGEGFDVDAYLSSSSAPRPVAVTASASALTPSDFYSFSALAGESLTLAIKNHTAGVTTLTLRNASGGTLATGAAGATNVDRIISGFVAPTSGTYYVEISAATATSDYTLLVNRNAAFDTEANDSFATAQDVGSVHTVLGSGSSGGGTTLTLNFTTTGWWDSTGAHSSTNSNYITGLSAPTTYRSFFVFNLGSVTQFITAAQLSLYNPTTGFNSPDGSETLAFFDVSTALATLQATGSGQTGIFNDLGSGLSFGSRSVSAADNNTQIVTSLNSDGIAALNTARGGMIAIGGAVTTIVGTGTQTVFSSSSSGNRQLILTLGEPADWYSFNVSSTAGRLNFSTITPSDGPNQFVNVLNPRIELYNPAGTLVASGTALSDGRNESLQFQPLTTGVYRIRVTAEGGTAGEYVLNLNRGPVAANDSTSTLEDTSVTFAPTSNDTDVDADLLTIFSTGPAAHGSVVINPNNTLTYTPAANYFGLDTFTYTISDGNGGTSTATVNLTVNPVNDAPSFTAGANHTSTEDAGLVTVPNWATNISAGLGNESGQQLDFVVSNDNNALFAVQPFVTPDGTLKYQATADANGVATITVRLHDNGGTQEGGVDTSAPQTFTITVNALADAPTLSVSPASGNEGSDIPLSVSAGLTDIDGSETLALEISNLPTGATLSAGSNAAGTWTLSPADLAGLKIHVLDNGNYSLNVKAISTETSNNNRASTSTPLALTVNNVAPIDAPIVAPLSAVRGQTISFSGSFSDPGVLDTHSVAWDFGDGSSIDYHPSTDPMAMSPKKLYTLTGTYVVTLTVKDNDGDSTPVSTSIIIKAVDLQDDPANPGQNMLIIGGTDGDDFIHFNTNSAGLQVNINHVLYSGLAMPDRIVAYGLAGNDDILISRSITTPAELYGDEGDDTLHGGGGDDIVLGGDGDDVLNSDGGRDILIGGIGADHLNSGGDDDLLIPSSTLHDNDRVALLAIQSEWIRTDRMYAERTTSILGGAGSGGSNGAFLFNLSSVIDDGEADQLSGSSGYDWFFRGDDDVIGGTSGNELVTNL